ncbi:MAG: response regulator [Terriglobia bacterium]
MDIANRHILFVDDFKDTREMYAHFLSMKGFQVTQAGDGQEAVEKAAELLPDLIVMDLSLPRVNGWEASRRLKASDKTKHIPVLILTAYDLSTEFADIIPEGCAGVLMKPCLPNDMLAVIGRVLDGHPPDRRASPALDSAVPSRRSSPIRRVS